MKNVNVNDYQAMSMRKFLINYAGLTEEMVFELMRRKATHKDIKKLGLTHIRCINYERLTEEDIRCGDVILVSDFHGSSRNPHVAPYIRPSLLREKEMNNKDKTRALKVTH